MCKDCGCSGDHHHGHHHNHVPGVPHTHVGADGKSYTHTHEESTSRQVNIGTAVLGANDAVAAANREWFRERNITVLNLISSPGSGKTSLLVETLKELGRQNIPAAVIVGDQYGTFDAERMKSTGAAVTQIETRSSCHLDASRVREVLETAVPEHTRILFIENVGNLVCPVAFDLGEDGKIALLSTPEGEEKPLKYPALFAAAEAVLITKCDLEKVLDWNYTECIENIKQVNPDVQFMRISSKTGEGFESWMKFLQNKLQIG